MGFKEWRMKRKLKKEEKRPYDVLERDVLDSLKSAMPGTDEYDRLQSELKNTNIMRAESKESKRRISKSDKGNIVLKVLGLVGGGLGLGSIIWSEYTGMTFTGQKRTVMDAISRGIGNIFVNRK